MIDKTVSRHLYRIGVLLKHRPVDERAAWRFEPGRDRLESALRDVFGDSLANTSLEAVALSTCARSEIYVASVEPCSAGIGSPAMSTSIQPSAGRCPSRAF